MLTVAHPFSVSAASATASKRRLDVSARAVMPAEAVPFINCDKIHILNAAGVDRSSLYFRLCALDGMDVLYVRSHTLPYHSSRVLYFTTR